MKKLIFCVILFSILNFSNKGFADNGCSVMNLTTIAEGTYNLVITNPYSNSPETVFAGAVNAVVDGNAGKVYCIDLDHNVNVPSPPFNDSGFANPSVSYITMHYFPYLPFPYAGAMADVNREAAAIQLAIWQFTDNVDPLTLVGNTDIRDRAIQIIADANLHAGVFQPFRPLQIIGFSIVHN